MRTAISLIPLMILAACLTSRSQINRVLNLDGVDDYVSVPDSPALRLSSGNFTFCAWIKLRKYDSYNSAIFYKRNNNPSTGYLFTVGGTTWGQPKKFYYQLIGAASPLVASGSDVPLNRWTHVAMTYSATDKLATIYLNGAMDGARANTPNPASDNAINVFIGRDSLPPVPPYGFFFDGRIDEIQVWARALTSVEIQAAMQSALSGQEQDLIAYWNFDRGTHEDISGNGHVGVAGSTTAIISEPPHKVEFHAPADVRIPEVFPTTQLELQYTTNLLNQVWIPVTRDFRRLQDGSRTYQGSLEDPARFYRVITVSE
jgi:hypothetical protein